MTEENKNWFYKLRYTSWGRILTFVLIVLISGATGFGIYSMQPERTEKEITDDYIRDRLVFEISESLEYHANRKINNVNLGIKYTYENKKTKENYTDNKFENIEKIKEDKGNLVFVKGKYTKEGVELLENNLKDDYVTSDLKEILGFRFKKNTMQKENSETINSTDKDYMEKMRSAETFSIDSEDPDIRYTKNEYGTFYPGEPEEDIRSQYETDIIKDSSTLEEEGIGYIYPKGRVTIYNTETYKLENADFVFTVDKSDIVNNPYCTENIEKVLLAGFLPGVGLAIVLLLIFNGLSEYENMKQVKYIKFMDKWYIDVSIIGLGIIFLLGLTIPADQFYIDYYLSIGTEYSIFIIMLILVSVMSLMIFSYFILLLKGLFNNGIVSTIKNKTLTFWVFKKIISGYKKIKNTIEGNIKDVGTLGVVGSALVTLAMAVVVIFFSIIFRAEGEGAWFILGVIAIALTYTVIYNIVKNIKNINDTSAEIAKGNYEVKVDESMPYFKNIAHNFNTIGDNLTTAVEEQVKAERMRTELITNVSHDLKTPLTSIINYSKILIDEESSKEEKEEYAQVIHEKALKLKVLIEDLFQISKATSNNIEFEYAKLDFSALVLQGIGEWKDNFEEKNLEIVFNKPDYPVVLMLDGSRTYRVIDNLMGNICKYAQGNTRVYIDLKDDEEEIKLTIKNISAYELNISAEELMERFTRGDKSRNTDGSGLGLSIASSLIEGQGGKFNIDIDGDLFKVSIKFKK
ncbi:HAMP domain-containing sensor histidine kinase [Miniphocaeibacter massiliensis]|uniref:HAMP domain-containing sensor histidine kinase n=1 Tax=Miniphocaeibacter massiliensis TaxID=2041841 RepID=UPI001F5CD690|nr:HAMP domain-containing sensor histidine kinase [Miniphocaeibacter massiliensis]